MPFKKNKFDLVSTTLALEQMRAVQEVALKEISRVSKNYISLFIIPRFDAIVDSNIEIDFAHWSCEDSGVVFVIVYSSDSVNGTSSVIRGWFCLFFIK
jgi:hypothetical protein